MGNLNTTSAELQEAFQRLRQRWEETKPLRNDPVRRRFEKEHWTPLERQVQATQREMEQLAQVIAQARRSVK
ncbi:MAG: hypothetical protein ACE5LU_11625 [Anaerolineae bacterium]